MCTRQATRDHGGALPLVILMTVLLALSLSATAVLTQSAASTVTTQAAESGKRAALVTGALQQALRELTPSTGRLLGVDPVVDPAGSCVGQLAPYRDANGAVVSVDCAQAPNSGRGSALSSLVLVGDGSDCGTSCVTGQDGGLQVVSNSAMAFKGILINVAGAWDVKKVALNPIASSSTALLQPNPTTGCPASSGFQSNPACQCPSGMDPAACFQRDFPLLQADVASYVRQIGSGIGGIAPSALAVIPSCTDRIQLPGSTRWAMRLTGGTVDVVRLAQLNQLFVGITCAVEGRKNQTEVVRIGDGSSSALPMLLITGVVRFQDTSSGSAMAAKTSAGTANSWTINSDRAVVVMGEPIFDSTGTTAIGCDASKSGGMLQFAGSTYLRLDSGHMYLCPMAPTGAVIAAPTADAAAGFVWQGPRNQPLFATRYGSSGGEVLTASGVVFAPAAFFDVNSQDKDTQVTLQGGSILRALRLTANQSTGALAKGSFFSPNPTGSGQREVQLRFWDVERQRDLGFVQVVINDSYPTQPALGYRIEVWRTMW